MRLLTPQEGAVFDAIVKQRLSGDVFGDIFVYDLKAGQQFLHDNNLSVEYGIDHIQQWNIINQLAKDEVISIDLMNIYEVQSNNSTPKHEIRWCYNTDWAHDYIQMGMSIEECFKKHNSSVFINLSLNSIKYINNELRPVFKTKLSLNKDPLKVDIICNNGKIYTLKAFNRESAKPHDAFVYAYNANREVSNKELSQHITSVTEDEYVAKIFERNTIINTVLAAHVELNSDSMCVTRTAQQTPTRIALIEEKAVKTTIIKSTTNR